AHEKGGPGGAAAVALLLLTQALDALGERERARSELARARAALGRPEDGEPRGLALLRRRADWLEDRLESTGEPRVAARVIFRDAESQEGAAALLERARDPEVRAEILDVRRIQAVVRRLAQATDLEAELALIVDAAIELAGAERG